MSIKSLSLEGLEGFKLMSKISGQVNGICMEQLNSKSINVKHGCKTVVKYECKTVVQPVVQPYIGASINSREYL